MTVAIHQPNFLPWLGYFNKLASSDIFVLLDDVQFPTGHSFGNRVLIKSYSGSVWLTVPVHHKGEMLLFNQIQIENVARWREIMVKTILVNYSKTKYFNEIFQSLSDILYTKHHRLLDLNLSLLKFITQYLETKTRIIFSSELKLDFQGENKIFGILKALNASEYLSGEGKGSKRYINDNRFEHENIKLVYQHFQHPEYPQLYGEFIPKLSIIDLLFNCGRETSNVLLKN